MGSRSSKMSEGRYLGTEKRQRFLVNLVLVVVSALFVIGILAVK